MLMCEHNLLREVGAHLNMVLTQEAFSCSQNTDFTIHYVQCRMSTHVPVYFEYIHKVSILQMCEISFSIYHPCNLALHYQ